MNTKQIALDRQQAVEAPCTIGASGHASAFQPFSGPSGLHSPPAGHIPAVSRPSDRTVAASGRQSSRQSREAAARQEQDVSNQNDSNDASAAVPGQGLQAFGQSWQGCDDGSADAHNPDRPRAGPNDAVHGAAGAADTASLEAASDTAMAEQFRDMRGDAWKVFYMASKMGLRPDIIEKAANRLRGLQQNVE